MAWSSSGSWGEEGWGRTGGGVPPPILPAWNPDDAAPVFTFSNGNRTALAGALGSVRTNLQAGATQDIYVEFLINTRSANVTVGFATNSEDLSIRAGTSFPPNSFGISYAGQFSQGGNSLDNSYIFSGFETGDVCCIAYRRATEHMWTRTNNGVWIGSAAGDPVTGTNGLNVNVFGEIYVFPIFSAGGYLDKVTINSRASEFAFAPPTGYTGLA